MNTEYFDTAIDALKKQIVEISENRDEGNYPASQNRNSSILSLLWGIVSQLENVRTIVDEPRIIAEMEERATKIFGRFDKR